MKKWQKLSIICALFITGLFGGILQLVSPTHQILQSIPNTPIQASYSVFTKSDLEALSNSTFSGSDIVIDPTENITDALLENFILAAPYKFSVIASNYTIDFSMRNVTLHDVLDIAGSPIIRGENINISSFFESNQYTSEKTIGTPTLILKNANASLMRFRVSGGIFIWNNSRTSSLILRGFTSALLNSDNITGDLIVEGNGIVTIENTQIHGNLIETISPTVIPAQKVYVMPYAFFFQPQITLDLGWTATDNIRGSDYALQCNLTIYKNGQFQQLIEDIPTNSYQLAIDTAASSYIIYISCVDKQGNITVETISVVFQPDVTWFILMILIIVAAAFTSILLFYRWKQRQWQKTALVEIPT
ncbi:MAG: hypothetical protein ACTSRS_20820 [Candidatus Helarchaeota archaeon]